MLVVSSTPEAEGAPGKGAFGLLRAGAGGDFFFVGAGGGEGGVLAGGVVVAPAGGVGECIVGVVYFLEFLCAGSALGGVGGDAVGVGFEGLSRREVFSEIAW